MTLSSKVQIGLLLVGVVLAGWELQRHLKQGGELAAIRTQALAQQQELDSRATVLAELTQRNQTLQEAEERAGNQTLLSLLRERNAATLAVSQTANQQPTVLASALAKALDSPEHREVERESLRAKFRADLDLFFRALNLPPDKIDQYTELQVEMERRKSDRRAALLNGRMTFAEALRQRDQDDSECEQRRSEILGENGCSFLNGIADGMRNDEAKRLLNIIQKNMSGNALNEQQSGQLQALIKAHIVGMPMEDVEPFRPPEEWTRLCVERQQKVLNGAAEFLTPTQLDMLKTLSAFSLAEMEKQMMTSRKVLGIMQTADR